MADDPAIVGARVLAALQAGRLRAVQLAQERAAPVRRTVRRELDVDILNGHGERGRAGRIARRMRRAGLAISERNVLRILAALSSVSDSV